MLKNIRLASDVISTLRASVQYVRTWKLA